MTKQNDANWKGSRLRCLLLSDLQKDKLHAELFRLIDPGLNGAIKVQFDESFLQYPKALSEPNEIQLDKAYLPITGYPDYQQTLRYWWLKEYARTPVWDWVCTATIDNLPGLILIEAKAHKSELGEDDKCKAGLTNRPQIAKALHETNQLWDTSFNTEHHFQLSNRFAWGLQLAKMGIPVILIYLGSLQATEMLPNAILTSAEQWQKLMQEYSSEILSDKCNWDRQIDCGKACFYPIIRSINIQP
jgi:hypothetical protein